MPLNEYDDILSTGQPLECNAYYRILNQQAEDQKTRVKESMFAGSKSMPDAKAEAVKLSRQTNVPVDVVERNKEKVSQLTDNVDYDLLISQNPGLSKWLEKPENAAIGRDDLENLAKIEKSVGLIVKRGGNLTDMPGEMWRATETGWHNLSGATANLAVGFGNADPRMAA